MSVSEKIQTETDRTALIFEGALRDEVSWEAWLSAQAFAPFRQSPAWAQINQVVNGDVNYALSYEEEGEVRIAALMSHRIFKEQDAGLLRKMLSRHIHRTFDCRDGLVFSQEAQPDHVKIFLEDIERLARKLNVQAINFYGGYPVSRMNQDDDIKDLFLEKGYEINEMQTAIVDLTPDLEEIFAGFHRSAQKGIRKCEKEKITIKESQTLKDFRTYFLDPALSAKEIEDEEGSEKRESLFHIGYPDYYNFFTALDASGNILATLGTYRYNGLVTETTSSITPAGWESKLPAQDLLHWHAFQKHKSLGDQVFDLAGFLKTPRTPKEEGIKRFKLKWGNQALPILQYKKVL